ncbi:MAG: hypothetical protein ABIU58_05865, partial [Ramlibacter sp.]
MSSTLRGTICEAGAALRNVRARLADLRLCARISRLRNFSLHRRNKSTMAIPRRVRRFIARLLIGVMLFAQMAVAAYACAGAPSAWMNGARASAAAVSMAGAELTGLANHEVGHAAMDAAQQNLCAAHCQSDQQNAGGKPIPDAPAAIPM